MHNGFKKKYYLLVFKLTQKNINIDKIKYKLG